MLVAYNNSELHFGHPNHVETHQRVTDVVEYLKENLTQEFLTIDYLNKEMERTVKSLILLVHNEEELNNLNFENMKNTSYCSFCGFATVNNCKNKFCSNYKKKLNDLTTYKHRDQDTFQTKYTLPIIYEAIYVLKLVMDKIAKREYKYGYCLIRPPGHHCSCTGFCFVNNALICAEYAQISGYDKILILDIDVHHCDGTAKLIDDTENIFVISMHRYGNNFFPFTGSKEESNDKIMNLPFPSETHTDEYIECLNDIVFPKICEYQADMILISNGFDAHKDDPLGGMLIDDDFYLHLAKEMKKLEIPIIYILEGGYNIETIKRLSLAVVNIFNE
jgi:acetoin utilization deacetylase AcuC-like enzyme